MKDTKKKNINRFLTITAGDYLLAGVILIVSLASLFVFAGSAGGRGSVAAIYQDGKEVKKLSLYADKEFEFSGMKIEIKESRIRVEESDCPRKICVETGWISSPRETIICMPDKVIIQISGEGGSAPHAVSY